MLTAEDIDTSLSLDCCTKTPTDFNTGFLITRLFLVFRCLWCFLMWFSLCLSVILLRSVSCVFTIKIGLDWIDNFFCYDSSVTLSDRVKIWLTSANLFLPKFCPEMAYRVLIWASETLMENCGRMVRDNAMVTITWRADRKPSSVSRMVP